MKKVFYITGLALLFGCGKGYELTDLYVQKIKDSDKVIYNYEAWSTLNDGSKFGFAILDENESKDLIDIERKPFRTLATAPQADTIFVIRQVEGGTRVPKYLSTEIEHYKDFVIKIENYQYASGASNLTYTFSGFSETENDFTINGIEKVYELLPTSKNHLTFHKGNIKLIESASAKGTLDRIEVYSFLLDEYQNRLIDKQIILKDPSVNFNGLIFFTFKPTRKMNTNEFSNYGFYKKRGNFGRKSRTVTQKEPVEEILGDSLGPLHHLNWFAIKKPQNP